MQILHHKILGDVKLTDVCRELNKTNPDKTSTFIECGDETREVPRDLIEEYCRITIRTTNTVINDTKEDIIETKFDDQIVWKKDPSLTFINSGDMINIIFRTNKLPNQYIEFHNKFIRTIKNSKESGETLKLNIESIDDPSKNVVYEISWRKKP